MAERGAFPAKAVRDAERRRAAAPTIAPGDLLGVAEVAAMLGVSKQRVTQLRAREDFPAPVVVLAAGPIWTFAAILVWKVNRDQDAKRKARS